MMFILEFFLTNRAFELESVGLRWENDFIIETTSTWHTG